MIVAGSASPLLLSSAGGYNLTKSLRFRGSATAYLNRSPSSATNRKTWTWSGWVKRGTLGAYQPLFGAGGNANQQIAYIGFSDAGGSFDKLELHLGVQAVSVESWTQSLAVYRDPSAWYHVVVAVDTTQATSSNRVKFYVNGSQLSVNAYATYNTYPSQNYDSAINNNVTTLIGNASVYTAGNFDGYLAEVNFIDGQALTPSSFGQTSSTTGVWQPIRYTGTYGTNGFYLPFTDVATTSGSNAGLGKDFSGNNNYWTTNNISVTSGSTYDSMNDVPTLTNATTANYATLNPITGSATLSNGNLAYTSSTGTYYATIGTMGVSSGKWYWEFTANGAGQVVGICGITNRGQQGVYVGSTADSYGYYGLNGQKYNNGSSSAYGATYTTNDVIGIALDMDAGTIVFYKNNASQGTAFSGLSGTFLPMASNDSTNAGAGTFNFGQRPFAYTPPTGFVALNTFNLPTPTIGATASSQAGKYFNPILYTGNGSSQTVTGFGFDPDMVWHKGRSVAYNHSIVDVIRGNNNVLFTNTTDAEANPGAQLALATDGATVTYRAANLANNQNAATYVIWGWKANGSGSTNTAGSITSTVSANTTAGFSIVTWTGTGANATVGHGLGVAPSMVIVKSRTDNNTWWLVYHQNLTSAAYYLALQRTDGQASSATVWNNTAPTSTVFTVGTSNDVNGSTKNLVAYCFAQVAGYSAFGSYTGNGSSDGPFVFTGFRPKFLIVKRTNDIGSWIMTDSARSTYNVTGELFNANTSGAEFTTSDIKFDYLSNGFKLREVNGAINASGSSYIYMAFAEVPYKFSNAR